MPTPTNPITDTKVTTLDWAMEPERKLQGLLQLFIEKYFSAAAFQTRNAAGGLDTKTFARCDVRIQETELGHNPDLPVIDVTFDSIQTARQNRDAAATRGSVDKWLVTIITKVPSSMASVAPTTAKTPEHTVRRIADQVRWLFGSAELDALRSHGVHNVMIERPPTMFNAGVWLARLMTVTMETYSSQAR